MIIIRNYIDPLWGIIGFFFFLFCAAVVLLIIRIEENKMLKSKVEFLEEGISLYERDK